MLLHSTLYSFLLHQCSSLLVKTDVRIHIQYVYVFLSCYTLTRIQSHSSTNTNKTTENDVVMKCHNLHVAPVSFSHYLISFVTNTPVSIPLSWWTHLLPLCNLHTCSPTPAISSSTLKVQFHSHSLPNCFCIHATVSRIQSRTDHLLPTQFVPVPVPIPIPTPACLPALLLVWLPGSPPFWHWSRLPVWSLVTDLVFHLQKKKKNSWNESIGLHILNFFNTKVLESSHIMLS